MPDVGTKIQTLTASVTPNGQAPTIELNTKVWNGTAYEEYSTDVVLVGNLFLSGADVNGGEDYRYIFNAGSEQSQIQFLASQITPDECSPDLSGVEYQQWIDTLKASF